MSSRFEKTFQGWMNSSALKEIAQSPESLSLGHLPASAQAFVLAALARLAPKQTFLALTPGVKAQEELANDLEAWDAPHLFFPQVEAPTAETQPDREGLFRQLQEAGYTREAQVQERGQFSVRGAVVDIFSWDTPRPLRTEWEDEELISLREFDVDAQRSVQTLKSAEVSLANPAFGGNARNESSLRDYLAAGFVTVKLGAE